MQEKSTDSDRWRELADLLGLPPDPEKPAAPVSRETHPPAAAARAEVQAEEELASDMDDEIEEFTESVEDEREPVAEVFDSELGEEMEITEIHGDNEPGIGLAPSEIPPKREAAEGGDEEEPRRGRRRRRGRRGRRGGAEREGAEQPAAEDRGEPADDLAQPAEASLDADESFDREEDPFAPPAEDDEEKPGRKRRRRRRRKPEAEPSAVEREPSDEEELDAPLEEVDDEEREVQPALVDAEEEDNLADWDVPSWQELIASLYRPDR